MDRPPLQLGNSSAFLRIPVLQYFGYNETVTSFDRSPFGNFLLRYSCRGQTSPRRGQHETRTLANTTNEYEIQVFVGMFDFRGDMDALYDLYSVSVSTKKYVYYEMLFSCIKTRYNRHQDAKPGINMNICYIFVRTYKFYIIIFLYFYICNYQIIILYAYISIRGCRFLQATSHRKYVKKLLMRTMYYTIFLH